MAVEACYAQRALCNNFRIVTVVQQKYIGVQLWGGRNLNLVKRAQGHKTIHLFVGVYIGAALQPLEKSAQQCFGNGRFDGDGLGSYRSTDCDNGGSSGCGSGGNGGDTVRLNRWKRRKNGSVGGSNIDVCGSSEQQRR